MAITLRVSSHHAQTMGANATRIFESGGSIGRVASNDWVLPDPDRFISGEHAAIIERNGQHFVVDRSTNGTHLNGRELPKGSEAPLGNGDIIGIGEYQIAVMIDASVPNMPGNFAPPPKPAPSPVSAASLSVGSVDPLDLIRGNPPPPPRPDPNRAQADNVSADQEFFAPPVMQQQSAPRTPGGIPDDWMNTGLDSIAEPPQNVPPRPKSAADHNDHGTLRQAAPFQQSTTGGGHLNALLRGAGLDPTQVDQSMVESLGAIVRIAVQGMIELLQSRAEFKNQFRVAKTTLKPIDNNPLKMSATVEDAMFNMFVKPNSGYQSPAAAFQEGIDDVKAHQLAMMAGMRAGYKALLRQFDPEALEELFDRGLKRGRFLDVVNKTKYWDLYKEMCSDLGDDDQTFRRLFGDEFAEAYESQMQHLARLRKRS